MSTVSLLGYSMVYGILISVITFGINLRKGLAIFMILAIGGIMTDGLKRGLKLPRPSDIDVRVIEPGQQPSGRLVDFGGANSFWSLPTKEAIVAVKNQTNWSYGLPSGHVSAATAFLLGLLFFYRKKGLLIFSVCWVILMALSRMYLGRHFIADVIGGVLVGGLAVLIAVFLFKSLEINSYKKLKPPAFSRISYFVIPLVLLTPFIGLLDADNIGRLLGLIVAYFIINQIGQNSDSGKTWLRVARIFIAVILSLVMYLILNYIIKAINWEDTQMADLVTTFLQTGPPFLVSFVILRKLNFYSN
ncbi:phosphatase PAP2 family protein [uncultured Psychroserpens sp.]|uniref:phosphatase PAP2 family protein n=1 Tax=uncultured Psychroserpens sp. TaxID=255436 RepID=UPI003454F00D